MRKTTRPSRSRVGAATDRPTPPWAMRPRTGGEHYLQERINLFLEADHLATLLNQQSALEKQKASGDWTDFEESQVDRIARARQTSEAECQKLTQDVNFWREKTTIPEYAKRLQQALTAQRDFNAQADSVPYPLLKRDTDQMEALLYLKDQLREER